ncbi:hypothetical protein B5X24_HaOG207389 [Helicoverpa armigera]|uniref:Uncharacterized protein n=1 Tax=Helicoverpa armigera TaxID=29058 RepID=A0A2W1BPL3_HELAM|nr:hypothetical protein B5X24_HaOG207389 [Helicoverpa armigera]
MFIHMLLLLPTVEPANLVINEYSMKQVKVDNKLIDQILANIFPEHDDVFQKEGFKGIVKFNAEPDPEEANAEVEKANGFLKPSFETQGQTRFKKITNRASEAKFNLRGTNLNKSEVKMKAVDDSSEKDPMYFLSKLVIKLMEYLPPKFKVPVRMPQKKKKPKLSNKNGTEEVKKAKA